MDLSSIIGWVAGIGLILFSMVLNKNADTGSYQITMSALNRPYVFTNKTKTAAKWGIKIRLTLTKNEGYEGEVAIYGFGGAFE